MTHEEAKKMGATHSIWFDGCLYFFLKKGVHMHQLINGKFNPIPFSCASFFKFKPL